MFHYYFLGNPEGIGFDAPDTDYLTCIWARSRVSGPAEGRRADRDTGPGCLARRARAGGSGPTTGDIGAARRAGHGARRPAQPARGLTAPRPPRRGWRGTANWSRWRRRSPSTRLWLDRDVAPERPTFSAVAGRARPGLGHRVLAAGGARRAVGGATGGSVVELHSYACRSRDVDTATRAMRAELAALWPETADAGVVHLQQRMEATAPTFPPGSAAARPGCDDARGIRVAGDYVETPFLTGLMERAASRGAGGERRARRGRRGRRSRDGSASAGTAGRHPATAAAATGLRQPPFSDSYFLVMCSIALQLRLRQAFPRTAGARRRIERRLRLTLKMRNDLCGKQFRRSLGRRRVRPLVAHLQHAAETAGLIPQPLHLGARLFGRADHPAPASLMMLIISST